MPKITSARLRPEEQAVILAAGNFINELSVSPQVFENRAHTAYIDLVEAIVDLKMYGKPRGTLVEHEYVICEYCGQGTLRHKNLNGSFYCHNDNKVGLTCYENAWIKIKAHGGSVV